MKIVLTYSVNMNGDKYNVGMGGQNYRHPPCHQAVHSWAGGSSLGMIRLPSPAWWRLLRTAHPEQPRTAQNSPEQNSVRLFFRVMIVNKQCVKRSFRGTFLSFHILYFLMLFKIDISGPLLNTPLFFSIYRFWFWNISTTERELGPGMRTVLFAEI